MILLRYILIIIIIITFCVGRCSVNNSETSDAAINAYNKGFTDAQFVCDSNCSGVECNVCSRMGDHFIRNLTK